MPFFLCLVAAVAGVPGGARRADAQASLAADDIQDALTVGDDSYTLVRDAVQTKQWYYVPLGPRLFERVYDGKREPEFNLLKYQFNDPRSPGQVVEGGILQFAVTLGLPAAVVDALRQKLIERLPADQRQGADQIRLAPLPLKSAQANLYAARDGLLLPADPSGTGNAPTFAGQKMIFSIPLTQIGADVYDSLVNGNTGLPVALSLTYGGITAPVGFTVSVDWDQTYEHYSKDQKFAARASYFGLVSAGANVERKSIYNDLVSSQCIKVDVITGMDFKIEEIDKYLQPILARINSEMLENLKPPARVDPASAPNPKTGGWFGGAGYSVSIKKETDRKHGKELISFNVRQYQERLTRCDGFVGVGQYPKPIRDKLVTVAPAGRWEKAFFTLPTVFADQRLGIASANLTLILKSGAPAYDAPVVFNWTPSGGWQNAQSQVQSVAVFPLMGLRAQLGDAAYEKLRYEVQLKLIQNAGVVRVTDSAPIFNGQRALAALPEVVEKIGINGQNLSWARLDPSARLTAVQVKVTSGAQSYADTLRPKYVNGVWSLPDDLYFLVPASTSPEPLKIQMAFLLKDGTTVEWKHSGEDLRQSGKYLDLSQINLQDADWQ